MLALLRGESECPEQRAFRARVTAAAVEMREHHSYVYKWGPDDGFLGEGRIARHQLLETQPASERLGAYQRTSGLSGALAPATREGIA